MLCTPTRQHDSDGGGDESAVAAAPAARCAETESVGGGGGRRIEAEELDLDPDPLSQPSAVKSSSVGSGTTSWAPTPPLPPKATRKAHAVRGAIEAWRIKDGLGQGADAAAGPVRVADGVAHGVTILFVRRRWEAEGLAAYIDVQMSGGGPTRGIVRFYHGKMGTRLRRDTEAAVTAGEVLVLVATSAAHRGIHYGKVRRVAMLGDYSDALETVVQSAGRAGRQNPPEPAIAQLVLDCARPARISSPWWWEKDKSMSPLHLCEQYQREHMVRSLVAATGGGQCGKGHCRSLLVSHELGEDVTEQLACGHCDLCLGDSASAAAAQQREFSATHAGLSLVAVLQADAKRLLYVCARLVDAASEQVRPSPHPTHTTLPAPPPHARHNRPTCLLSDAAPHLVDPPARVTCLTPRPSTPRRLSLSLARRALRTQGLSTPTAADVVTVLCAPAPTGDRNRLLFENGVWSRVAAGLRKRPEAR